MLLFTFACRLNIVVQQIAFDHPNPAILQNTDTGAEKGNKAAQFGIRIERKSSLVL